VLFIQSPYSPQQVAITAPCIRQATCLNELQPDGLENKQCGAWQLSPNDSPGVVHPPHNVLVKIHGLDNNYAFPRIFPQHQTITPTDAQSLHQITLERTDISLRFLCSITREIPIEA
jgi:hypothetical protein